MNILLLNWRDPKNPKSGGAEKLNMQILKPLVKRGDTITWYAMGVKGLPDLETVQGIRIVRYGNQFSHLLLWPILYWTGKFGKTDLIIDCIHGTGYLSTLFVPRKKKFVLICEVAQNIWDEMYSFPINKIGKAWERIMFKFYANNIFWTISESTKKDLINYGVKKENIVILPMGFDAAEIAKTPAKSKEPTALFVGRLAEMKGVKDAIKAIAKVNNSAERKWKLTIIGRGEKVYEQELRKLVSNLNLNNFVRFLGFVDENIKFEEMSQAWVLLAPSSREGWGMIVTEANFVRTCVMGYNVPGIERVLRQSSSSNIIVEQNFNELAAQLLKMHAPVPVTEEIISGWDALHRFVRKNL